MCEGRMMNWFGYCGCGPFGWNCIGIWHIIGNCGCWPAACGNGCEGPPPAGDGWWWYCAPGDGVVEWGLGARYCICCWPSDGIIRICKGEQGLEGVLSIENRGALTIEYWCAWNCCGWARE